jgi:hypothetical protein
MAKNLEDMATPHEAGLISGGLAASVAGAMGADLPQALLVGGLTYGVARAGQHLRRFTKGGPSVKESVNPNLNKHQNWNGR